MGSEEELQEMIKHQHGVINLQAERIDRAVDLLEALVFTTEESNADKIEEIIRVLMYGET